MSWTRVIACLKTIPEETNPGEFYLAAPIFMFRMIGIWPLPDRTSTYLKHLYLCFGIATFANVVWTLVSIIMAAMYPSPKDTVADVIIQLGISAAATAMSSPLFAMLLRRRHLLNLASSVIEMLSWDAYVRRTKSMNHLKIVPRVSCSLLIITILNTFFVSVVMGGFITKAWLMDHTSLHGILIPSQFLGAIEIIILIFASTSLFCTFVLLLTSQMEALEMQFDEIFFTASRKSVKSDRGRRPVEQFQYSADLAVKKCIIRHQVILTCMNMLQDVYELTLLFFFLFLMAAVCCLAVCMTMVEKLQQIQVFSVAATSFSLLVLLQAYCWLGTLITTKADSVATAAYKCGWYNFSSYTKKSLLLVIARANKKFEITAAGFVPVNIITMVHILQETFSYILVMSSLTTPSEEAAPRVIHNSTLTT